MPALMKKSMTLPRNGRSGAGVRSVALRRKLLLGAIAVMLSALLPGCAADKHPSQKETSLANAAKDVSIPLEAGTMKNPLPETDEVLS